MAEHPVFGGAVEQERKGLCNSTQKGDITDISQQAQPGAPRPPSQIGW